MQPSASALTAIRLHQHPFHRSCILSQALDSVFAGQKTHIWNAVHAPTGAHVVLKAYSKRELNPRDAFLAERELEQLTALRRALPNSGVSAADDGWRLYVAAAHGAVAAEAGLAPHFDRRDVVVRVPGVGLHPWGCSCIYVSLVHDCPWPAG